MMSSVFVTGAAGFIGKRLCDKLRACGYRVFSGVKDELSKSNDGDLVLGELQQLQSWPIRGDQVDWVVHLAARAHVLVTGSHALQAEFEMVNAETTIRIAGLAADNGVSRFVFLSSIGVNGPATQGTPFTEADAPAPAEPYAISKWKAEEGLWKVNRERGMQVVILRPPLIYGPGAKGNLLRLLGLIASGWPLPFADFRAPRNFIGLDNICDLIAACIEDPAAANETFVAAEPERRSLTELIAAIALSMDRGPRLWTCPKPLLWGVARVLGSEGELRRLSNALEVDSTKATRVLGWRPRISFADGIAETAQWYLRTHIR